MYTCTHNSLEYMGRYTAKKTCLFKVANEASQTEWKFTNRKIKHDWFSQTNTQWKSMCWIPDREGFVLLLGKVRIRAYLLRMLYGRKPVLENKKIYTFFWGPSTMASIQELGLTFLGWSLWNQVQHCVGAASGGLSQFTLQQKTIRDCMSNQNCMRL